jgi:hypothetical protein
MGGTLILNPSVEAAAVKPLQFSQFFTPDGYTENLEIGFEGSASSFGQVATAFYGGLWAYSGW